MSYYAEGQRTKEAHSRTGGREQELQAADTVRERVTAVVMYCV